jgi:CRISPR/Cas system-associated endoribonuclease Cas2
VAYFVVTYDVRLRNHSYQPLYDQLNAWQAAHLQDSVWLLEMNATAAAIRDALMAHMHRDDTACVVQLAVGANWATRGARPEGTAWLQARFP